MKLFLELLRRTFKPSPLGRMDRSTYRIFTFNAALLIFSSFVLGAWIAQKDLFPLSIANAVISTALNFNGALVLAVWITATQYRLYDVGLGDPHEHDPDYDPANFPRLIPEGERIKGICKLPSR